MLCVTAINQQVNVVEKIINRWHFARLIEKCAEQSSDKYSERFSAGELPTLTFVQGILGIRVLTL